MAVYKRGYEPYAGPLTPEWARFLIIARYAYRDVFESKFLLIFFVICFLQPVVKAIMIYLPHNAAALELLDLRKFITVDGQFFLEFLRGQGTLAFLLTGFIGPSLISRDLANNALPLYLCRPFSRAEYVIGKMSVLAILLSAITWAPGLLLFAFQSYLAGAGWFWQNLHIASAIFLGSWTWIFALCLLALSISAWVRWRMIAGALILGVFFVAAGFGAALNEALSTRSGHLINAAMVIETIWSGMFRVASRTGISEQGAWTVLIGGCWACLFLLSRKVRAYEVERS